MKKMGGFPPIFFYFLSDQPMKPKYPALFLLWLLISVSSWPQDGSYDGWILRLDDRGEVIWEIVAGTPGIDAFRSIAETGDGGFIAAGHADTGLLGPSDGWLIRIDESGRIMWDLRPGGEGSDAFQTIRPLSENRFIGAGYRTGEQDHQVDLWLAAVTIDGELLWELSSGYWCYDAASDIRVISEHEFLVLGSAESQSDGMSEIRLLRMASDGRLIREKGVDGGEAEYGYRILDSGNTDTLLLGVSKSSGATRPMLMRVDNDGIVISRKILPKEGELTAGLITEDGGMILAGFKGDEFKYKADAWIVSLTSRGRMNWERIFGGSDNDYIFDIKQTSDGGFIAAGATRSKGSGKDDVWIIRLDSKGRTLWDRVYGGTGVDRAYSVLTTSDGGFVVAGYKKHWTPEPTTPFDMD